MNKDEVIAELDAYINTASKKPLKRDILVHAANLVYDWMGMPIILRQYHYRIHEISKLVSNLDYENTRSSYNGLSKVLSEARFDGRFAWRKMIDETRDVNTTNVNYSRWESEHSHQETNVKKLIENEISYIRNRSKWFSLDRMLYQPDVVLIILEKAGLEAFFKQASQNLNCYLIACKGFSSSTQIKELADSLLYDSRNIHAKTFTDFDPSGKAIESSFYEKIEALGVTFASKERVALTQAQIQTWNLPFAPVKKSDSRAKNWTGGVVEMDAIDPIDLRDLIRANILKHFDTSIDNEVVKLERVLKKRISRQGERLISKIMTQVK